MNAGEKSSESVPSRRQFLEMALAGATVGLAAEGGKRFANVASVIAQSNLTPDSALEALIAGNQRFMTGSLDSDAQDLAILRQHTIDKQEPFAAVLSCADSRVPVELVFDQSIGHVFVTRVAGNLVSSEIMASLEYGAAVLGTKVIVVLGHASCGAVKATIQGKAVPGQISALYPHIQPAIEQAGSDVEAATRANAKIQANLLREASPVLGELIKKGELKVVAGYYDTASGKVTLL